MALTLNSNPTAIDNSGAFNITTSLSEDATHVNLRVRCDITVAAVVVATVEKPKGLADFDMAEILKSLITGISFARDSGDLYKVSGGSPLVAYTVLFTEVWEDASGTLTTGDTDNASGSTFRYVPARSDGTAFTELVLHDDICLFANKTLRNNVCKFFPGYEMWLVFFTSVANLELFYSKDGGAYDHATHFSPTDGWGVIVINSGEIFSGVTSNVRIQLGDADTPYAKISEVITIYTDSSVIDERLILEYDGLFGGKEYLAFEGLKHQEFITYREYYRASNKNRKGISFTGVNLQKLETRFKDINNAEYLKSLLTSETVKKIEPSYATATDVTIVSDTVKIVSSEIFTNQIAIEYEY